MTDLDENREAARKLAGMLAAEMPGWVATIPPCRDFEPEWCDLVRADGAAMRLRVGGWKNEGRVNVYGLFPSHKDGTQYTPRVRVSVTCSVKRKPHDIARDIERRFLPQYLDEYVRAVDAVRVEDQYRDEAQAVAERLAAVVEGSVQDRSSRVCAPVSVWAKPYAVHSLQVRPGYESVHGGRGVEVDFRVYGVSPETAAAVLQIITQAENEAEALGGVREKTVVRVSTDEIPDEVVSVTHVLDAEPGETEIGAAVLDIEELRGRAIRIRR